MTSPRTVTAALLVTSALALAGCGGGSSGGGGSTGAPPATSIPSTETQSPTANPSSSPSAPANAAAATKQIKAAYKNFFSAGSNLKRAEANIEGGASLKKTLLFAKKQAKGATEGAKVTKVMFTGATTAAVKYDLSSNGNVLLPNADGQAIQENGKWKVAKGTLCGLLSLAAGAGNPVPGCTS